MLLIVMLELHETVHIVVGRLICGCWGPRDFNVWSLCNGCSKNHPHWWLATLAGPLFSFALMWLGTYWINTKESGKMTMGFSLIFANIPFGRISTVMMGGGDEMVVTRHFLTGAYSRTQMILICSVLVLGVILPPVINAFRILTNRWAWLYLIGFLTFPLLFLLLYVLIGLNTVLSNGFLATSWLMGTPILITLHTGLALLALVWLRKSLFSINTTSIV
ncbi:hypothetical protein [Spirosoma jeollabukense]